MGKEVKKILYFNVKNIIQNYTPRMHGCIGKNIATESVKAFREIRRRRWVADWTYHIYLAIWTSLIALWTAQLQVA